MWPAMKTFTERPRMFGGAKAAAGRRCAALGMCGMALLFADPAGAEASAKTTPGYPVTRRDSVVDVHGDVRVGDPYRWLERLDSQETTGWLAARSRFIEEKVSGTDSAGAPTNWVIAQPRDSTRGSAVTPEQWPPRSARDQNLAEVDVQGDSMTVTVMDEKGRTKAWNSWDGEAPDASLRNCTLEGTLVS